MTYPYVFEYQDELYMLPETNRANALRLYRADPFPHGWTFERTLMTGAHHDASLFEHAGMWWLLTCNTLSHDSASLYMSVSPFGPWAEHPCSPITEQDRRRSRPAGRVIATDGKLYRFTQESWPRYGSCVWAHEITRLDASTFEDRRIEDAPVLAGSGRGWNAQGMHHVDAHRASDGRWLAAVDGWRDHVFVRSVDLHVAWAGRPGSKAALGALGWLAAVWRPDRKRS